MKSRSSSGQPAPRNASLSEAEIADGTNDPGLACEGLDLAVAIKPALLRDALSRLLDTAPQLRVVGYGKNVDEIREVLLKFRPRVLLLDYESMGPNGESTISHLRRVAPATRILVVARQSGEENVQQVLRAGASGLVGKQEEFATLVRAIQAVAAGELWANRRAVARTLESLTETPALFPAAKGLTKRELEIVDGVALGLRNKEIARQLKISQATVKSHLNTIFRRLKIEGRVALALLARERGKPKD